MDDKKLYLSKAQLKYEFERCLNCKNEPCYTLCPVGCNSREFIEHAKAGDFDGSVRAITAANPMGETCGLVCPDKFCMRACTRSKIDFPINIPKVQASILKQYRNHDNCKIDKRPLNGHHVAVVGAGPAGIAASAALLRLGYRISIFEAYSEIGGALNLIPDSRLPHDVIERDWEFIFDPERMELKLNTYVQNPAELFHEGFDGVIICTGEPDIIGLNIPGEENALTYFQYLRHPEKFASNGHVAIIGGGKVAADCALTASQFGAKHTEMFVRRKIGDMKVSFEEIQQLLNNEVDITTMTFVKRIFKDHDKLSIETAKSGFDETGKLIELPDSSIVRSGFDYIVKAIGSTAPKKVDSAHIIYAGDCKHGGSTLVEALASGIEAVINFHKVLTGEKISYR